MWRGLYMKGLIFGILGYLKKTEYLNNVLKTTACTKGSHQLPFVHRISAPLKSCITRWVTIVKIKRLIKEIQSI